MKVINLFGGPGISKSTTAAGIFYDLKSRGVNCELVTEFAKVLAWENNHHIRGDQLYVTVKQNRGLERLRGKVDFAITDSPLLLGVYYGREFHLKNFDLLITELFNSYDNINFLLERNKPYRPEGRFQTEEEAKHADAEIEQMLIDKQIPHTKVSSVEHILRLIDLSSV